MLKLSSGGGELQALPQHLGPAGSSLARLRSSTQDAPNRVSHPSEFQRFIPVVYSISYYPGQAADKRDTNKGGINWVQNLTNQPGDPLRPSNRQGSVRWVQ